MATHSSARADIKPENVLLLAAGSFPHVQLGDFGLASDAPGKLQRASSQCGTVSYLPPEALRCRVTQESYDALAVRVKRRACSDAQRLTP